MAKITLTPGYAAALIAALPTLLKKHSIASISFRYGEEVVMGEFNVNELQMTGGALLTEQTVLTPEEKAVVDVTIQNFYSELRVALLAELRRQNGPNFTLKIKATDEVVTECFFDPA